MESARALSEATRQIDEVEKVQARGYSALFHVLESIGASRGLPAPKVIAGLTARSVAIPFGDLPSSLRAAESTVVPALYQNLTSGIAQPASHALMRIRHYQGCMDAGRERIALL